MESQQKPTLEFLALAGEWRAILARVGGAAGGAPSPSSSSSTSESSITTLAAWRIAALVKLRNFSTAELELERLDLDNADAENIPFAIRWCAADVPARVGRPADGAAAFARLAAFCDRRASQDEEEEEGGGKEGKDKSCNRLRSGRNRLWSERAESACWAAAGILARGDDPRAARAWARAALDRRARRVSPPPSSPPSPPSQPPRLSPPPAPPAPPWQPPLTAGAEALSAAARLELALGNPSEARRLFSAAASAAAARAEAAGGRSGGEGNGNDEEANVAAPRASALLRLSAGDAPRAAAGFRAIPAATPVDLNNESLCLLHSGDASRARAVALESLLVSTSTSTSTPSPLLFSEAALRTAAALADLAPPAAARAARDALFDAVQAAGPPEDLDASFLAAA